MTEQDDIARILAREELSFEDVKIVMRFARYERGFDERIEYANTLLSHAGDYLPPHVLDWLVRADITEEDAAAYLDRNKAFFSRLTTLLPSIVRFFGEEARSKNPEGIISCIDDCHYDFHVGAASSRKDRQLREAKEKLVSASKLSNELSAALTDVQRLCDIEFERYNAAYSSNLNRKSSTNITDLIHALQICGGVLEILNATAEIRPERFFIGSNDTRSTVVKYAYQMCTFWNGPKLVTTPGSDFSALCSLLYEVVSGWRDEGLAGAINRYARSDNRKQWDREGRDADEAEDDNFATAKHAMAISAEQIELCEALLEDRSVSDMARALLRKRINHEQREYDTARSTYGPHQVLTDQLSVKQTDNMLDVNDLISIKAKLDVALGRMRRSVRSYKIDV